MTWTTLRGQLTAAALAAVMLFGGPAQGALRPDDVFVLFAIYYLDNGRPFGSTDYGLRTSGPFCDTQRDVLLDRWRSEGGQDRGADALYLAKQGYTVRLVCMTLAEYENPDYRNMMLRRTLSAE